MSIYSLWSTVFLIFFCMANQARAVEDLVQTPIESSIIFNSDVACGTYLYGKYYAHENGGTRDANGTKVTSNGTIGRDATVTWVDISTGVPQINSKNVTAKVSFDKLKSAVSSNPSKYPALSSSLNAPGYFNDSSLSSGTVTASQLLGSYVYSASDSTYYPVPTNAYVSYQYNATDQPTGVWVTLYGTNHHVVIVLNTGNPFPYGDRQSINYDIPITDSGITTTAPMVSATPAQFAKTISSSPDTVTIPQNVYSDYYQDIDDYIKDNPNVMEYVDTEDSSQVDTAPDFVGPLGNCRDLANANAAQYMKPSCLNVQ